jgi:PAS domain-containing protein
MAGAYQRNPDDRRSGELGTERRGRPSVKLVCSYCQRDLGEREPLDDPTVSHGMCTGCYAHFRKQWRGLSLSEYLDDFPYPVIVVDENLRAVAANKAMAERLGTSSEELVGLKGGEALECLYARQPGGCGSTLHCKTCAIRNSVTATFETGEPCVRVPASLVQGEGRARLLVSTHKRGPVVQVVIEPLSAPADDEDGPRTNRDETPRHPGASGER